MASIEKRTYKHIGADGIEKVRHCYKATITLRGFPRKSKTFDRKTDASLWAEKTEYEMRYLLSFGHNNGRDRKVSEAIARYLDTLQLSNPRRAMEVTPLLRFWSAKLGQLKLSEITTDLIAGHREHLQRQNVKGNASLRRVSNAWVNRQMAALSRVFSVAQEEWRWISTNPMASIKALPEPAGRTRFLNEEELERLLKACTLSTNKDLKAIVCLAIITGMRKGEIRNIRMNHFDVKRGEIILWKTKNEKPRLVKVVEPVLQELIKRKEAAKEGYQFFFPSPFDPKRSNDFRSAWETAVERSGIPDFHFHDLRHSAASFLAMNGGALHDIAEVLGHSSIQVTKRYIHLIESRTKGLLENTAKAVFKDDKTELA